MVEPNTAKDKFLVQHTDFSLRELVNYPNGGVSKFYDNGIDMVIIDENICVHDADEPVFSYMLITDKQNNYMHMFQRVFRFLGYTKEEVDKYLSRKEITMPLDYQATVADRAEQAEVSPLELHFEQSFSKAYGINALKYLTREYGICDENGKNYFLDYLIRTQDRKIAVEENGVSYHHPQIIGKEKYRNQLRKQNTCALWGIKLFRFSTEDCTFENRIEDDIKQYFGKDASAFIDDGLKIDRKVELYEHQEVSLQEIQKRREAGIKAYTINIGRNHLVMEYAIELFNFIIYILEIIVLVKAFFCARYKLTRKKRGWHVVANICNYYCSVIICFIVACYLYKLVTIHWANSFVESGLLLCLFLLIFGSLSSKVYNWVKDKKAEEKLNSVEKKYIFGWSSLICVIFMLFNNYNVSFLALAIFLGKYIWYDSLNDETQNLKSGEKIKSIFIDLFDNENIKHKNVIKIKNWIIVTTILHAAIMKLLKYMFFVLK